MNSTNGDTAQDVAESVVAPHRQEDSQPPRKRGGLTLALLIIAFAGGIIATIWGIPVLQKWWSGSDTATTTTSSKTQALVSASSTGAASTTAAQQQPAAAPESINSLSVATLEARLAAVSAKLDAISTQAAGAGGNAARAEGLLIAFATRRALDRGSPLGYLEGELRLRFGEAQPRAVTTIVNAANQPVTLADLQSGLDDITPVLIGQGNGQDWWTTTKRELANLIVIRNANEPSPVPRKIVRRAKQLLSTERVDNAVEEIERLPNREGASEWLQIARQYNEARRALDVIEAAAILEPRSIPTSARPAGQTNVQAAPPPPAVRTAEPATEVADAEE